MTREGRPVSINAVYLQFKDFQPHIPRGNHVSSIYWKTRHPPDSFIETPEVAGIADCSYHRELSFTDEQLPYVIGALEAYHTVLKRMSFSEALITYALQFHENFAGASLKAIKDSLTIFQGEYEYFMPAMNAQMQQAGMEGMISSLSTSSRFLALAYNNPPAIEKIIQMITSNHKMIRVHGTGRESPDSRLKKPLFEVWCLGNKVHKEILKQSQKGALYISERTPQSRYEVEEFDEGHTQKELSDHMELLWLKTLYLSTDLDTL